MNSFSHRPVLVREILEHLSWSESSISIADLTVGGGGHLHELLLKNARPQKIMAIDQDPEALQAAKRNLEAFEPIDWKHSNFRHILKVTNEPFDRILVDLGVSSHQLDRSERGFSFQKDGPLDMRMNPTEGEPISDWLMHCTEAELAEVIWEFGDEPRSKTIARKWLKVREEGPITTTKDFVEALGSSLTAKDPKGRHPLTRVFQALRMKANEELEALQELLECLPKILSKGGRVGILTFHSLEDREVKWGLRGRLKQVHKKAIQASEEERRENPRSRSAKLRVYEKE